MLERKEKKKLGAKKAQKGYYMFEGLGHDRGFLYRDRAFGLCVATWSSMSRHGSQAAGVAKSRQSCFSPNFLSRQCFVFCSDNVTTKVPCRDREDQGKRLGLQQEVGQGQEFYVATELAMPGVFCHDRMFLCRDRV